MNMNTGRKSVGMRTLGQTGAQAALLSTLRDGLSGASDAQLRQVVAMVDRMEQRGAVDALLAPLRPRLARLQPARPMRFARLLFLPLDPIIVAPPDFTPARLAVPRHALTALADFVRDTMGAAGTEIEARIDGHDMRATDILRPTVAALWPAAAEILARAARITQVPPGWESTGLPPPVFATIASTTAIALRHAHAIEALATEGPARATTGTALEALLDAAYADGPAAWRLVLALLLLRLGDPLAVLRAATTTARVQQTAMRVAAEQAVESALDHLERQAAQSGGAPGGEAVAATATRLGTVATLLDAVAADGTGPERARRVAALRSRLDTSCQSRLRQGLTEQVLEPLAALTVTATDEAGITRTLEAAEAAARAMRALESTGRRLNPGGGGDAYPKLLHAAAAKIGDADPASPLTRVDRARLVELLAGTDAALALLNAPAGPRAA